MGVVKFHSLENRDCKHGSYKGVFHHGHDQLFADICVPSPEIKSVVQKVSYSGFHPLVRNVLLQLFAKSCEGLLGQNVAKVSAHQPGEVPKSSSLKPCIQMDENCCMTLNL